MHSVSLFKQCPNSSFSKKKYYFKLIRVITEKEKKTDLVKKIILIFSTIGITNLFYLFTFNKKKNA